jgi:hypothetical protein
MANTVSTLSYANTFGDWVVTTNALTKENNDLAANNYTKSTGTLYLNDPTLGLQVANNAIVAGQLQVQGVGSSAYVQNNMNVGSQLYLTNTTLGLVSAGVAQVNGTVYANSSGIGLYVANNASVIGTLSVGGLETVGGTLTISGETTVDDNLIVTGDTDVTGNVSADYINLTNDVNAIDIVAQGTVSSYGLSVVGNGSFTGQVSVGGNFVISGTTVYSTNNFTINEGSSTGINSSFIVNRGTSGANAAIRWNESSKYWDIFDVDSSTYSKILTNSLISSSLTSTSSSTVASSAAANTLNSSINTANTFLQNYTTTAVATALTTANTNAANASYLTTGTVPPARITGVSTLTTGTWQASTITHQYGGTGLSTTPTNGQLLIGNGAGYALSTLTSGTGVSITNGVGSVTITNTGVTTFASGNTSIYIVNASTGAVTLSPVASGASAGSYGSASSVPVQTVDSFGRVTNITSTPIAISSGAVSGLSASATTDTTNASNISSGTLNASRLPTSGVSAGTYGGTITIPVIVSDTYGRTTSASNVAIRTSSTSQTGIVQLSDSISNTSTSVASTANSVAWVASTRAEINPSSAKNGDIQVAANNNIYIYANSAWRQIFPAIYQ